MFKKFLLALIALNLFFNAKLLFAQEVYQAHTYVKFVSTTQNIKPGEPVWIGLHMKMDQDWHVYWKNPGDSGLEPKIKWELPEGFKASEIYWPYPKRIDLPPLASYGYEREVFLFTKIETPETITTPNISIKARVDWLTCKVDCIPGRAELTLDLPVTHDVLKSSEWMKAFEDTQKKWPIQASQINVKAFEKDKRIFLEFAPVSKDSRIEFFPNRSDVIEHAAVQGSESVNNSKRLTLQKSHLNQKPITSISGIAVNSSGWTTPGMPQAMVINSVVTQGHPQNSTGTASLTILLACFFAFIGGMILNLMPCVLPVLSLKILHLVHQSHDRRGSFLHGLVFALGVIVSFWILALLLFILRFSGQAIGWGFQFQSPAFVVFISFILFIFALNLFRFFEIGTSLTGVGASAQSKGGLMGSFYSGVLATIVATPCTAPFMGTALSFALTQEVFSAFLVFTFLGVGMALPMVVLSAFPQLLRWVPKPGAWMQTLKNILGFVLLMSVVWLVWVFGQQRGANAVMFLVVSLLSLMIALYLYGRSQLLGSLAFVNRLCMGVCFLVTVVFAWWAIVEPVSLEDTAKSEKESLNWKSYSPELMDELRKGSQPIFLDFTAAWCLSCQVNDRVALQNKRVVEAFDKYGIIAVKADWTNNDPQIATALSGYGRNSIPLYVFYPDPQKDPIILPEIITPALVLKALETNLESR